MVDCCGDMKHYYGIIRNIKEPIPPWASVGGGTSGGRSVRKVYVTRSGGGKRAGLQSPVGECVPEHKGL